MVYVINKDGKPLMPTKDNRKVRLLLKNKAARVVTRTPFTIQLLGRVHNYTQPITLGVDAGYKHIGMSASTETEEVYASQIEERTDIVDLITAKRECRRTRRGNKTRYREARFDNRVRTKHKGWLAPSVEHKIQTHIKAIQDVCNILPISKIRIETAEFDIHKIKNPNVSGKGYQLGEKYGFVNTRNYVLWRDNHKCRCCGKSDGVLYVVNAEGKQTTAPEDLYTVCENCMREHLKNNTPFTFKKKRYFAPPTQMGIMRDTLLQRLKNAVNIPVEQTYGYETKGIREKYGFDKFHTTDAYCIAANLQAEPLQEYYFQKKIRCHNRKIHKAKILKGGIKKLNQAPYEVFGYRLFDKVSFDGKEYFIAARRQSGYFCLRDLSGNIAGKGATSYKKIRFVEPRKPMLTERRTKCLETQSKQFNTKYINAITISEEERLLLCGQVS